MIFDKLARLERSYTAGARTRNLCGWSDSVTNERRLLQATVHDGHTLTTIVSHFDSMTEIYDSERVERKLAGLIEDGHALMLMYTNRNSVTVVKSIVYDDTV